MVIRPATDEDHDAIRALRQQFVNDWGESPEHPFTDPYHWTVATLHGRIIACLCTTTFVETRQVWCWDFYREATRVGIAGCYALASWLETQADSAAYEIVCTTPPQNVAQIRAATGKRVEVVPEREGRNYEIVAVMYRRKPRSA